MSNENSTNINRRTALMRLGLGAFAAYAAPAFSTLSMSQAASSASGGGASGGDGDSSGASGGDSDSSGASGGDGDSGGASGGDGDSSGASGGDGVSSNSSRSRDSPSEPATISVADHERARRAVSQGRALPLSDVLRQVNRKVPGRLISVTYRESFRRNTYILKMVLAQGRVVVLRVNAQTAAIIR